MLKEEENEHNVEGKILAIAQYVIKYDYMGNTKGKEISTKKNFSTPFMWHFISKILFVL